MHEIQLDGLIAPTHHYGALSHGNKASMLNRGERSNPQAAALQALDKMADVMQLGMTQCLLPPLFRPDLDFLRACGFSGKDAQLVEQAADQDPYLLSLAQSCAFTWTANCGTFIPSTDSEDQRCHLIPANLLTTPHRALEGHARYKMLRSIFKDCAFIDIHEPLPMTPSLADEGAANHHRCYNPHTGDYCHVFVHSSAAGMPSNLRPQKFPARQSKEAQLSVARLARIQAGHSLFITQDPRAVDAGAFHNDVVFAGDQQHLLIHELALIDTQRFIQALEHIVPDMHIQVISKRDLNIDEAVRSYLFNCQFLHADGRRILLLPLQCQEKRPRRVVDKLLAQSFVDDVRFLDLEQSMRGGGGPACLRLRLQLSTAEKNALPQSIVLTEDKLSELRAWVRRYYRSELHTEDLADPALLEETKQALDALTQLLQLGPVYAFQS